jgi:hypothetical protein
MKTYQGCGSIAPHVQNLGTRWRSVVSFTPRKRVGKQYKYSYLLPSFLGSTAQLRPWFHPQNLAEFLGGFSTIFFLQGRVVSPTPNPHPGGQGLCIYIPQRQGGIDHDFLLITACRPALGPTDPPIQWVRGGGGLSLGVRRPEREADHIYLVPRSRMRRAITQLSIRSTRSPVCLPSDCESHE